MLLLGLWRAPEAPAQDITQCIGNCYKRAVDEAVDGLKFCENFYGDIWKTDPNTWGRIREVLDDGGWASLRKLVQHAAKNSCKSAVNKKASKDVDRCDEACEIACGKKRRYVQGKSARRVVCQAPPPGDYTPPPPPAPNVTEDPCWSCREVGGDECGTCGKGDETYCNCQPKTDPPCQQNLCA